MAGVFEVGKTYEWMESGYDPITVLKRTNKSIKVTNGRNEWRMLVRVDDKGEYVVDSSVPPHWRDVFTARAIWEYK